MPPRSVYICALLLLWKTSCGAEAFTAPIRKVVSGTKSHSRSFVLARGGQDVSADKNTRVDDNDDDDDGTAASPKKSSRWSKLNTRIKDRIVKEGQDRAIANKKKREPSQDKKRRK